MQIAKFAEKVVGDKRRWREYKARVQRLPAPYRDAVGAIERYLMYFGPTDSDSASTMYEDLIYLFEQASADAIPIREIVGEDPVSFVTEFVSNYDQGGWVSRERGRLVAAIDRAAAEEQAESESAE